MNAEPARSCAPSRLSSWQISVPGVLAWRTLSATEPARGSLVSGSDRSSRSIVAVVHTRIHIRQLTTDCNSQANKYGSRQDDICAGSGRKAGCGLRRADCGV